MTVVIIAGAVGVGVGVVDVLTVVVGGAVVGAGAVVDVAPHPAASTMARKGMVNRPAFIMVPLLRFLVIVKIVSGALHERPAHFSRLA